GDLPGGVRDVLGRLAHLEVLPDAQDRHDPVPDRRVHLLVDERVVLAVVLAPLRVPDHHVAAAELGEHRPGDVPGVGAGVVRRQVLRPVHELQLVAVDQRLHRADVGERRQDGHLDLVVVLLRQREGDLLHQRDGLEVVAVHLPVAGDERLPDGHQLLSSTAMPGKVLPSRYSSEAPPPVEMCENTSSGRPSARTAAAESPPPTTLKASESTIACATPRVPSANGASSNTPIGPFQNTVAAPESTSANAATDAGPMSRPFHP